MPPFKLMREVRYPHVFTTNSLEAGESETLVSLRSEAIWSGETEPKLDDEDVRLALAKAAMAEDRIGIHYSQEARLVEVIPRDGRLGKVADFFRGPILREVVDDSGKPVVFVIPVIEKTPTAVPGLKAV